MQVLQNNCIHFCLQLDNRQHIGTEHFDKISWLPIDQRFNQCFSTSIFNSLKLFQPLRTKGLSQKCLSYLGHSIWNGLPDDVKLSNNVNMFKYKVKKTFLTLLREKRSGYLCIVPVNYHHYHLILFMEL